MCVQSCKLSFMTTFVPTKQKTCDFTMLIITYNKRDHINVNQNKTWTIKYILQNEYIYKTIMQIRTTYKFDGLGENFWSSLRVKPT